VLTVNNTCEFSTFFHYKVPSQLLKAFLKEVCIFLALKDIKTLEGIKKDERLFIKNRIKRISCEVRFSSFLCFNKKKIVRLIY
jgi:hypothetical protein